MKLSREISNCRKRVAGGVSCTLTLHRYRTYSLLDILYLVLRIEMTSVLFPSICFRNARRVLLLTSVLCSLCISLFSHFFLLRRLHTRCQPALLLCLLKSCFIPHGSEVPSAFSRCLQYSLPSSSRFLTSVISATVTDDQWTQLSSKLRVNLRAIPHRKS